MRLVWLRKHLLLLVLVIFTFAFAACDTIEAVFGVTPVAHLVPQIVATYPHDPTAFTEGLFLANGHLYESTGRYGLSTLREVDPATGEVLRSVNLPPQDFGEGISMVGDHILQMTWQEGIGFVYNADTFEVEGTFPYSDEGWGMCYDGDHLYTSDGSAQITERDANSLAAVNHLTVTLHDQPVTQINELECVGDSIYSNVWHTDNILRIDKASGQVTAVVDASNLLTPDQRASLTSSEAVLNGIAYDPAKQDYLITGKLWPWMFEVQFVAP